MRIVFMGTPEFAVGTLEALIKNNYNVVGVVTAADKPAGRGRQMTGSAVKKYAIERGLKVLQPEKLKDENFITELRALRADVQVVVAFRMLPEVVWNMPPSGTYNLHASLLPRYRGAAPINWAIINGETETGVTTFRLKHEIDTGSILLREKVQITENMNAGALHDLLMVTGAGLMIRTMKLVEASLGGERLNFLEQDESQVCHAPKIFKEDCRLDFSLPVKEVYNRVRGLSPVPGAYALLSTGTQDMTLKITGCTYAEGVHTYTNGSLVAEGRNGIRIYCNGGWLELTELQAEGKKRMGVAEFLNGFRISGVLNLK